MSGKIGKTTGFWEIKRGSGITVAATVAVLPAIICRGSPGCVACSGIILAVVMPCCPLLEPGCVLKHGPSEEFQESFML